MLKLSWWLKVFDETLEKICGLDHQPDVRSLRALIVDDYSCHLRSGALQMLSNSMRVVLFSEEEEEEEDDGDAPRGTKRKHEDEEEGDDWCP